MRTNRVLLISKYNITFLKLNCMNNENIDCYCNKHINLMDPGLLKHSDKT